MQFPVSLLATALALLTSGVLGTEVKIAYTSNAEFYQETIEAGKKSKLEHPGLLTDIHNSANCVLWRHHPNHPPDYQVKPGSNVIIPPQQLDWIYCYEPKGVWVHEKW
ncbi:hypothetical protein BDV25DRAFT_140438 [Aspergillus avenaceus]|uniref:Uncharacterized protein n=1 Tax=Aspergillus avenaceus TaxID=36643 RepID=A0A5N6TU17_ASPAV|nr:hypothetical protein BDV25DRAFT_140438 [Aspergillus avenaceus]